MVKTKIEDGYVFVVSDYNQTFVNRARQMGGKWDAQKAAWVFKESNLDIVTKELISIYGQDGMTLTETATVEVDLDKLYDIRGNGHRDAAGYAKVTLFGRDLVRRTGRDYPVKLHPSVAVVEGGFPGTGGSMKNPALERFENTVLRVADVPKTLLENLDELAPAIRVIDDVPTVGINKAALSKEKQQLEKRLDEINKLLDGLN